MFDELSYAKLGIRGAKGAPFPRLCFAQLALTLLSYKKHYVTDGHPQIFR